MSRTRFTRLLGCCLLMWVAGAMAACGAKSPAVVGVGQPSLDLDLPAGFVWFKEPRYGLFRIAYPSSWEEPSRFLVDVGTSESIDLANRTLFMYGSVELYESLGSIRSAERLEIVLTILDKPESVPDAVATALQRIKYSYPGAVIFESVNIKKGHSNIVIVEWQNPSRWRPALDWFASAFHWKGARFSQVRCSAGPSESSKPPAHFEVCREVIESFEILY